MTTRYPNVYVLNVLSDDRPGIIATVGDAVARFEGNMDAVSQTVQSGYFTLIMIVSFPKPLDPGTLAAEVRGPEPLRSGLQVMARPYDLPRCAPPMKTERFVLTALGNDKPGIIRRLSHYLSGKDINIVDLYWDRTGEQFVMVSQLDIPARLEMSLLKADLDQMGDEDGFAIRLQHENVFVATNQLRLTSVR